MHYFRVMLSVTLSPSVFESFQSWDCWQKLFLGGLLGRMINQIIERIRAGRSIETIYDSEYLGTRMIAHAAMAGRTIHVVVLSISFDGNDCDPDGGVPLDWLGYEAPIPLLRANLHVNDETWTVEQTDGEPIYIPNTFDTLPSSEDERLNLHKILEDWLFQSVPMIYSWQIALICYPTVDLRLMLAPIDALSARKLLVRQLSRNRVKKGGALETVAGWTELSDELRLFGGKDGCNGTWISEDSDAALLFGVVVMINSLQPSGIYFLNAVISRGGVRQCDHMWMR